MVRIRLFNVSTDTFRRRLRVPAVYGGIVENKRRFVYWISEPEKRSASGIKGLLWVLSERYCYCYLLMTLTIKQSQSQRNTSYLWWACLCLVRLVRSSGVDRWSFLDLYPAARWTGSSAGQKMLSLQSRITFWLTMTSSARRRWNRRWCRQWENFRCLIDCKNYCNLLADNFYSLSHFVCGSMSASCTAGGFVC